LDFLDLRDIFKPGTTTIFNDNNACMNWSRRCTTKGLRHIQMQENHVRENAENNFVSIQHIGGKQNLADLFTKEMKDTNHFVELRDLMVHPRGTICFCWLIVIILQLSEFSCEGGISGFQILTQSVSLA
jgi:hypothetical protein